MSIGEGRLLGDREVRFENGMTRPNEAQPFRIEARTLVSLVLAFLGLLAVGVGAGLLWGWGGTLIAIGAPLFALGLLLGQGT